MMKRNYLLISLLGVNLLSVGTLLAWNCEDDDDEIPQYRYYSTAYEDSDVEEEEGVGEDDAGWPSRQEEGFYYDMMR
jgi:hypothetical protein